MKPIKIIPKNNVEWLKIKSSGIGASEISTICGLNPWMTAYELWLVKSGRRQPEETNDSMMFGKFEEKALFDMWAYKTGNKPLKGTFRDIIYQHSKYPFIVCTPDVFYWHYATKEKMLAEGKNPDNRRVDEAEKTWQIQLQYQLGITGIKKGSIVWRYPQRGVYFMQEDYDFNPELFESLVEIAVEWWNTHIVNDIEPDLSTASDVLLKYPVQEEGKILYADEVIVSAWNEMNVLKGVIKVNSNALEKKKVKLSL